MSIDTRYRCSNDANRENASRVKAKKKETKTREEKQYIDFKATKSLV